MFHVQPEDGHYQEPKHVVVPYVENNLYSTNKYSCVRPVHTLYISNFIEHNGDDEPRDTNPYLQNFLNKVKKTNMKIGNSSIERVEEIQIFGNNVNKSKFYSGRN